MKRGISGKCECKTSTGGGCRSDAVYAYPTIWPQEWWALCMTHAQPHRQYVLPISKIERGERLWIWDAKPTDVPRGPTVRR